MRIETVRVWMLVGFCLLLAGMCLYVLEVTEDGQFAVFLTAIGVVYFGVGIGLSIMHDRHMIKRTRAGDE